MAEDQDLVQFKAFMKTKPMEYDGDEKSLSWWFHRMEMTFRFCGVREHNRTFLASMTLKGDAFDFWEAESVYNTESWLEMRRRLWRRFVGREHDQARKRRIYEIRIAKWRVHFEDDLEELLDRFMSEIYYMKPDNMPDAEVFMEFMNSLAPGAHYEVCGRPPINAGPDAFEEYIRRRARLYDEELHRGDNDVEGDGQEQPANVIEAQDMEEDEEEDPSERSLSSEASVHN